MTAEHTAVMAPALAFAPAWMVRNPSVPISLAGPLLNDLSGSATLQPPTIPCPPPPQVRNLVEGTDPLTITQHAQFYRRPEDCKVKGVAAGHLPAELPSESVWPPAAPDLPCIFTAALPPLQICRCGAAGA